MDVNKIKTLTNALEYIESRLSDDITQEECAKAACCSLSGLQKMFRYIFHMSVGDYITRRRLSKAAQELQRRELSVLEIAVKYGYGSAEAFTRAFSRLWGMTPTAYRREWHFSGICPRLGIPTQQMHEGEIVMTNKFDISELYDYIREMQGTYIISFDVSRLNEVNAVYGTSAGDKVILESLHRIDAQCGDGMVMFRVGGDEFVLVTGLSEKTEVEALAQKILSHNGEVIEHDGIEIPVYLRAGAVLLTNSTPRYNELFARLVVAPAMEPGELKFKDE